MYERVGDDIQLHDADRKDNTPILYSSLSSKVTKRNSVCKKKSQLKAKYEGKF